MVATEELKASVATRARELLKTRRKELERYNWRAIARPKQLAPPGNWRIWLLRAGRGFGKTRTGAEYLREQVESGKWKRPALVAPTAADIRDVMVEGPSGILAVSPPNSRPQYEPSKRRLTWPNGAIATTYSADKPDRLRGPQHDGAWADEIAVWRYPEAWDMLMFGLRVGSDPRCVATTTPKPVKLIRDLCSSPNTALTVGSTYENRTNLAPAFFEQIISRYEGTRLGRQELDAELLEDVPDSLWKRALLDALRVGKEQLPQLARIVVAVDPAVTEEEESDETGIIVAARGEDGQGYILEDLSCRTSPLGWARVAIGAFHKWSADGIVGEVNNGGDMVETTLRSVDASIPFRKVRASQAKHVRAEPISALYEQGKCHHVGRFDRLEDQMCALTTVKYTGPGSPDHCDAAVYALTELMSGTAGLIQFFTEFRPFGPRVDAQEPAEANHVVVAKDTPLAAWWHRWISIAWGPRLALHWYAQHPDGRVHVYRELLREGVSAEEAGALVAENSLDELGSVKNLTAWLAPEYVDAGLGRKSIAQQFAEGIESVLGKGASFLFAYNDDERAMDPADAWQSLTRRRSRFAGSAIILQAAKDDPAAGWEHIRALLRWWPLKLDPGIDYDAAVARALLEEENGQAKFDEYMRQVQGQSDEVLPGLLIHDNCPELIRSLSALVRNEKDPGVPAENQNLLAAWSLLYGAIAHRDQQNREPVEEFIAKRLDAVKQRNPQADAMILHQVAAKAERDYKKATPTGYRFARLPRRRR